MGSSSNEEEEQKISQSQRNFRNHSENHNGIFAIIAKFRYDSENMYGPTNRQNSAQ